MQISRRVADHGSLLPSAANAIASIPIEFLHHEDHDLRHPRSAYETSLRLITAQWTKTFDDLDRARTEFLWESKDTHLLDATASYAQLLHRLNEHHDACYSVLRSLCRSGDAKPSRFHMKFLDQAKPAGWAAYKNATKHYREQHIGLIVNSLKHDQGELSSLYFRSKTEYRPGFYLRGVQPSSVLGPSLKLHPDGNSGFSFARDMLLHFWWLYRIGELLTTTIASILQTSKSYTLVPQPRPYTELKWDELVRRCAELQPDFFPDEVQKPQPLVIYNPSAESVTVKFPSGVRPHRMVGDFTVITMLTVDGAHPTEKLPYMGTAVKSGQPR